MLSNREIRNNVIRYPEDVDKKNGCQISSRTTRCKTLRAVLQRYSNLNYSTKYTSPYGNHFTINFHYTFMNNSVRGRVRPSLFM